MIDGAPASDAAADLLARALFGNLFAAALIHLLVAFPDGELKTRAERWYRASPATSSTTFVLIPVFLFTNPVSEDCEGCPRFLFDASGSDFMNTFGMGLLNVTGTGILIVVLVMIGRRWRAATRPQRRILLPVYASGRDACSSASSLSLLDQVLSLSEGAGDCSVFVGRDRVRAHALPVPGRPHPQPGACAPARSAA